MPPPIDPAAAAVAAAAAAKLSLIGFKFSSDPGGAHIVIPIPGDKRYAIITVAGFSVAFDQEPGT
jgi:hypothetical protein